MATALQIVQKFYPNVKTIEDAKRTVVLEVTKHDTQSRAVKNHKECALAVACKRALRADGAIICVKTSYIIKGDKAVRYSNPESIAREITSFDRNAGFEPGSYALSKVSPSNSLGVQRAYSKKRHGSNKIHYHVTENVRVLDTST